MKKKELKFDLLLAILALALTVFGVVMVYDTSVVVAYEAFGDKFFLFKNQFVWAAAGILLAFILAQIDYHFLKKIALPLVVISVILLVLVLMPHLSSEIYGSKRRFSLPLGLPILSHVSLQPSELAKFSLVVYLAAWLSKKPKVKDTAYSKKRKKRPIGWRAKILKAAPFLGLIGLVVFLTLLEPDLGTALIIGASSFLIYFLSGANLIEFGLLGMVSFLAALAFAVSSEYRLNRLKVFFNPTKGKLGISYHVNQLLIALGSGGLLGLGLGYSRQKYRYLPESYTDSIFAIIGEEVGFLGAALVVVLLLLIVWRGFDIAKRAPDKFGQLLAAGLSGLIGVQAMINLGGMVGLLPLTGVPLPFISYGGSSLTILLAGVGILLSISRFAK